MAISFDARPLDERYPGVSTRVVRGRGLATVLRVAPEPDRARARWSRGHSPASHGGAVAARSIRGREELGVTFVELFFDLVFVFAITQLTAVLAHDLTGGGVVRALIVFYLVWWAWTQYTWSLNEADTEHVKVRLLTLGAAALAFPMVLTVPDITAEEGRVIIGIGALLLVNVAAWVSMLAVASLVTAVGSPRAPDVHRSELAA